MATLFSKIKAGVGKIMGGNPAPSPARPAAPAPPGPSSPDPTIKQNAAGQSFSDYTPEELQARRRAILASVPFDLPFYRKFMNGIKDTWRWLGPIAFVVFTVWEVFYFMNHFLQAGNIFDNVLLWGISLIIEIPFMIATYDQAERLAKDAERRSRGEPLNTHGKAGSILLWLFLAVVNVTGQISFLVFVTHAGFNLASPAVVGLWVFILIRVMGVIMGDCYTAFYLQPSDTNIERVLRAQKAQMDGEAALSESDRERMRKDAESQLLIERVRMSLESERRNAQFLSRLMTMSMDNTLRMQEEFMGDARAQLGSPKNTIDAIDPITGQLLKEPDR